MQSEQEKVKEGHFSFLEGTLREQRQKKNNAGVTLTVCQNVFVYKSCIAFTYVRL